MIIYFVLFFFLFLNRDVYQWHRSYFYDYGGSGPGLIYMDNIDCSGSETHINNCAYKFAPVCSYFDAVAIICSEYSTFYFFHFPKCRGIVYC